MDPVFHWVVAGSLALLFSAAAIHKIRDFHGFSETAKAYRLVPEGLILVVAPLLVSAEIAVSGLILIPATQGYGVLLAMLLLLVYALGIAINLVRGRRNIDCGCSWGDGFHPISPALVVRNLVLFSCAALTLTPSGTRQTGWVDGITIVAAILVLALLYVSVERLRATRFDPV